MKLGILLCADICSFRLKYAPTLYRVLRTSYRNISVLRFDSVYKLVAYIKFAGCYDFESRNHP